MKKISIILVLFYSLTGCNVLKQERNFYNWQELALDYNSYIMNNCKHRNVDCVSDFKFGNSAIKKFEFNKFRKHIIDSCTNIKNGDFLIIEESGSGEVYYYFMYIFDLSNQKMNKKYKYSFKNANVLPTNLNSSIEVNTINFINKLDYVKLNDTINWGDCPKTIGINFVSYTSIKNRKIKFVKFISRPIAAAEVNF